MNWKTDNLRGTLPAILLYPAALLALVVTCYHGAPDGVFHFDDLASITAYPPVQVESATSKALLEAFKNPHLSRRPLPSLTFAVDWWRGAGNPRPFLITNVVFHALATIAVYWLLCLALSRGPGAKRSRIALAAFLGTAIWSAHPIQVQAVAYIVQRMTSMACLFVVLSVIFFLLARLSDRGKWLFAVACLVSLLLGSISKPNAWIAPLLLILAEFGVVRNKKPAIQNRFDLSLALAPFVAIGLAVIDITFRLWPAAGFMSAYRRRDFTLTERLLTQPRVVFYNLSQVFWPDPDRFSVAHDFEKSTGLFQPVSTALAVFGVLIWLVAGFYLLSRRGKCLWGFFLLWVPISLLPESTFVPLEMVFEHRMYLPLVGIGGLVSLSFAALMRSQWWESRLLRLGVISGAIACLALLVLITNIRVEIWRTEKTLWADAVRLNPRDARSHNNLGRAFWEDGELDKAVPHYEKAVELKPEFREAVLNLARSYSELRRNGEAAKLFERVIELNPNDADAHFSYGLFWLGLGQLDRAREELVKTYLINPGHPQVALFIGYIDSQKGQLNSEVEGQLQTQGNAPSNEQPRDSADG